MKKWHKTNRRCRITVSRKLDLPQKQDELILGNETLSLTITKTDKNDDAVDITGETWELVIKDDDSIVAETSNGSGDHSDPTNGETVLEIPASDTKGLGREEPYDYYIRRTRTNGKSKYQAVGEMDIDKP